MLTRTRAVCYWPSRRAPPDGNDDDDDDFFSVPGSVVLIVLVVVVVLVVPSTTTRTQSVTDYTVASTINTHNPMGSAIQGTPSKQNTTFT